MAPVSASRPERDGFTDPQAANRDLGISAAPDHPMIDHLWRDRRAIETVVVPTGRPLGAFAVAAMPLARWTSHALRDAAQHIRSRARL